MKGIDSHPVDFGPYLDRGSSDPDAGEISAHMETCARCRNEAADWQATDALFRNFDPLQVPQFQWQRIAARLNEPQPGLLDRWLRRLPFRQPAWSMGLAALVFAAAIWTGISVHKNSEEKQLLVAISRFAAQEANPGPNENPFRSTFSADQSNERNPFSVRR